MNLPQGTACSYYNGFVVPVLTLGQIALAPRLANFRTWQPQKASLNLLFCSVPYLYLQPAHQGMHVW